jgi:hypothetical protein
LGSAAKGGGSLKHWTTQNSATTNARMIPSGGLTTAVDAPPYR